METALTMLTLTILSFALARPCLLSLRRGSRPVSQAQKPDEAADAGES